MSLDEAARACGSGDTTRALQQFQLKTVAARGSAYTTLGWSHDAAAIHSADGKGVRQNAPINSNTTKKKLVNYRSI